MPAEVKQHLEVLNRKYKEAADKKIRTMKFSLCDLVMANISKGMTPTGTYSKYITIKMTMFTFLSCQNISRSLLHSICLIFIPTFQLILESPSIMTQDSILPKRGIIDAGSSYLF